jgi:hypothetical protein
MRRACRWTRYDTPFFLETPFGGCLQLLFCARLGFAFSAVAVCVTSRLAMFLNLSLFQFFSSDTSMDFLRICTETITASAGGHAISLPCKLGESIVVGYDDLFTIRTKVCANAIMC